MSESEKRPPLEKRVVRKPDGRYLILYSRPEEKPKPPRKRAK